MKTSVFLLTIVAVSQISADTPKLKSKEELKKANQECHRESGFEGGMEDIKPESAPKEAKCFLKCLAEKRGIIKEDGTLDVELYKAYLEQMPKFKDNPELKEKMLESTEACASEWKPNSDDLCETAYQFFRCRQEKMKAPK